MPDPRDAVAGSDVVILASRSERPVISADWVEPGTHVNTIGPKVRSAHEMPPELAALADVAAADSPAQAAAYDEPFFTARELTHLGAIIAGSATGRTTPDDITVYCSTGLAGSEVVVALALLEHVERLSGETRREG